MISISKGCVDGRERERGSGGGCIRYVCIVVMNDQSKAYSIVYRTTQDCNNEQWYDVAVKKGWYISFFEFDFIKIVYLLYALSYVVNKSDELCI